MSNQRSKQARVNSLTFCNHTPHNQVNKRTKINVANIIINSTNNEINYDDNNNHDINEENDVESSQKNNQLMQTNYDPLPYWDLLDIEGSKGKEKDYELRMRSKEFISYITPLEMNISNEHKNNYVINMIQEKIHLFKQNQILSENEYKDIKFYDLSKVPNECTISKYSVYDATLMIKKFINEESLTDVAATRLLSMMHELFPFAELPIRKIQRKEDKTTYIKSSISAIVGEDVSLTFQHCTCGATVYLESDMTVCKNCKEFRYYLCTTKDCPDKDFDSCKHNKYRTPRNTMSYIPLLHIIQRLLNTKTFIRNIEYEQDPTFNEPDIYVDLMHANESKRHLKEMQYKFNEWKKETGKNRCHFKEINLLFALNYDGSQVYKNKATTFVPLFITILNLPPSLRIKPDIGMFMLSIFTSVHNSNVENYLLHDLLGKELEILNNGLAINTDDGKQQYFVQGRLILHCLDTMAYQGLCKVKGVNSHMPCSMCRLMQG
jgi:hypothetical protein